MKKRNICVCPGTRGKVIVLAALVFGGFAALFAAPLDTGYAFAPEASASPAEKVAAFREARFKVLSAAEKYENTPYRYGGADSKGLDCSGLIFLSFRDALGISTPRSTTALYAWVEKIPNSDLQPGDLLFFKTDNTGKISHAGIFVGGGRFIHSASQGPVTGVIYSSLDEEYWASRYAGAGKALPGADIEEKRTPLPSIVTPGTADRTNVQKTNGASIAGAPTAGGTGADVRPAALSGGVRPAAAAETDNDWVPVRPDSPPVPDADLSGSQPTEKSSRFLVGVAFAPSWGGLLEDGLLQGGNIFRGFTSQVRGAAQFNIFGASSLFGAEIRPEYDGALGVFRLPFTISWGFDDRFRVFAGPVLSFGDAELRTSDGLRRYSGGTNFLGTIGITAAPFTFKVGGGELAPYGELAWQSYVSDSSKPNFIADFAAGIRFSTGIRFTWQVRRR
ncbi:MAG: C40 family peptidase [Treponema sp.]|jgi:probable lipoprotein NlpC|nr:C40 family peptidase [Treponema sp.]